jgi:hypothetical protein
MKFKQREINRKHRIKAAKEKEKAKAGKAEAKK